MKQIKKIVVAALFCVALSSPALNAGFLDKVIGVLGKVQQETVDIETKLPSAIIISTLLFPFFGLKPFLKSFAIGWGGVYWTNTVTGITAGLLEEKLKKFQEPTVVDMTGIDIKSETQNNITKIEKV